MLAPALLALAACSIQVEPGTQTSAAPATFTVDGQVWVKTDAESQLVGMPCEARSSESDIREGTQVAIKAADDNTVLAVASLDPGKIVVGPACSFSFHATDVPEGHTIYAFQVGSEMRKSLKLSREDLRKQNNQMAMSFAYDT